MNAVAKVSDDGQSAEIWSRHAGAAAGSRGGRGRPEDDAGQDQDQPATAGRRLRPAHLAGCPGAGGGDRQHRQEAGEAHSHPRGRHRRRAPAADDAPRAQGRARRQEQPGRLAPSHRGRERRCRCRAAAVRGHRAARTSSAGGAWSRVLHHPQHLGAEGVREIRGMRVHAWRGIGASWQVCQRVVPGRWHWQKASTLAMRLG
jgi:hypothetical protein